MPRPVSPQSPEVARLSGRYRFISTDSYQELGIDPQDVPLGTLAAHDHPPFLPDRFGGNAYGLGLFEQNLLPPREAALLESLDLERPSEVARHYRTLNDIFKRLGLLIRFTRRGRPFYLIPRQFVAHYLVEIQAKAEEIVHFLSAQLSRRLAESLKVCLVASESQLLLPELTSRMPQMEFALLGSLEELIQNRRRFDAVVLLDDPKRFALSRREGLPPLPQLPGRRRESWGYFVASRIYDLLLPEGAFLCLCDRPLASSRETVRVEFVDPYEFKHFLLFSHVFRTRRRYQSGEGPALMVNRFDFHAFLAGLGVYHETVEGLLGGRSLEELEPAELDHLPYQDLPLPRGSAPQMLAAWRRWLGTFFKIERMASELPEIQRHQWERRFVVQEEFPPTLLVFQGRRRRPPVSLESVLRYGERRRLAGCSRELLAPYKDTFGYVDKVLAILRQIQQGTYHRLPGLELSRLRKPFETARRGPELNHVLALVAGRRRLKVLAERLNPGGIMGPDTPVLANLEKLSLMGLEEGPLRQLHLVVLGHSTMGRVTFGKVPATTLRNLTDPRFYRGLDEAVRLLRLFRLLSVAETAAASAGGLSKEQVRELFALYDNAIRVVTDPELEWEDVLSARAAGQGGVQGQAVRKLLKLFNLFEFLSSWRELERCGPRTKEALAGYDPARLERIQEVVELTLQMQRFVSAHYEADSAARPYFFRALFNCELHGTGRLLPRLGTGAGFILLWICVHAGPSKLINFNSLLEGAGEEDLEQRLAKLKKALLSLGPELLPPAWLARLRESLAGGGEAYVHDSGLYLDRDPATGALLPRFLDPHQELDRLQEELEQVQGLPLAQAPEELLESLDRRSHEVERFLSAQEEPEPGMVQRHAELTGRLRNYLVDQLFDLDGFAATLQRALRRLPNLMNRLLPQAADSAPTRIRLAAAAKLSSLAVRRLERFQDMWLSHETARLEFGPTATGIVGVSPLQFQILTGSLSQLLKSRPRLGLLLMLAVLLCDPEGESPGDMAPAPRFTWGRRLEPEEMEALEFLLCQHDRLWRILNGEACLVALEPILARRDPPLVEALFLLSVVLTAARKEGVLSEDLLDRFFGLLQSVRHLTRQGKDARQAQLRDIEEQARRFLAVQRYRKLQAKGQPFASGLRHLLDTTRLPEDETREELLAQGRRQAGLDRLLRLRGLLFVNSLDLLLLRNGVPVRYIYRMKGLRSMGETHFERDLYEGLRVFRGLQRLEPALQHFVLETLADPDQPLGLWGFSRAAELLTYANQIRLLFLGLAAARALKPGGCAPRTVSFLPLARVIERKFELINQAVTELEPSELLGNPRALERFMGARERLTMYFDPTSSTLSLDFADLVAFDRKIEAVRRAKTPDKLKRLYHQELRRLKLTTYSTLDYQQRLEETFQQRLEAFGDQMLERVRQRMSRVERLEELLELFEQAWEEGLELPLERDRQESLRDLLELNLERLRGAFLDQVSSRLARVEDFRQLDALWREVRRRMQGQGRYLGREVELAVAQRFDRRASELRSRASAEL